MQDSNTEAHISLSCISPTNQSIYDRLGQLNHYLFMSATINLRAELILLTNFAYSFFNIKL